MYEQYAIRCNMKWQSGIFINIQVLHNVLKTKLLGLNKTKTNKKKNNLLFLVFKQLR